MKGFIGFTIIFIIGIVSIFGLGSFLEINGYSQKEILIYSSILAFIIISIPPLLLFFGGRNDQGENKLEELGKPVTFLASSLLNPTSAIIFLLVIILNILIWK